MVVQVEYRHGDAVGQQRLREVTQVLVRCPLIVEVRAVHEVGAVEHTRGQLKQIGKHKEPNPTEECPRAARDCLAGPPHGLQLLDREVAEEAEEEGDHEQLAVADDALEAEELE